ncbi:MAG TPA: neutral/alkaline non-lysosomal ceramidase N-terminal domain-containing protein [Gemmataceae bacterium]|nr:neutral/alkaline non-lysosomal ceramidase N-terminal domain-containing protein [Gemmataceae bacterium]
MAHSLAAEPHEFKAGVASRVITPAGPHWMSGYANRNKPASTKIHDLRVKALALEDPAGGKLVILTSDLVGIPRGLSVAVAEEVHKQTGLPRDRLMLTCSHTHCGPVVRDNLADMYEMPPEEAAKIGPYTDKLREWMIETVVAALADLKPARLCVGMGTARFAINRRSNKEAEVPKLMAQGATFRGPVDHDVPVLRVTTPEGKLRAVVFGYACHNTTMQFYQWCGDYAGFAQQYLEEKHPGAMALFWIGCGGDQNPLPRSKIELCEKYGRQLADAVEKVLAGTLTPVRGATIARYREIALPFDKLPAKEQLTADALSKSYALRQRATRLLKALESGAKIDDRYAHYPVQVWRLGDGPLWVALGGEVVVDYSLRLKKELAGDRPVWIIGYANDVMAYIPSERVRKEGGYEGDSSMIYYGHPTKWGPGIEEKIMAKVHRLGQEVSRR